MEWYHEVLAAMAIIAVILAWRVPNAVLWVGLGTLSFVTSAWWHNAGFPYGTLYGAATNLAICFAIYKYGKDTRWEGKLMSGFILMLLLDLLYVCGAIKTQYIFAVSLEVVNAYCLLLIWATGVAERIGNGRGFSHPYRDVLGSFNRAVFAERKEYPKWWRHP